MNPATTTTTSPADAASLDRLHDVIVPPPAPWWPPAPGWRWVIGILAVVALILLVRAFIHWQRNRYRREALAEWHRQVDRMGSRSELASSVVALSVLLKRAALSAFQRNDIATLTGPAWAAFLNRTAGMTGFDSEAGRLLERAAYGECGPGEIDEPRARQTASLVREWIGRHRVDLSDGGRV